MNNTHTSFIKGVGTAVPHQSYSQLEILELCGIQDRRIRSMFLNSAINRRHLTLPVTSDGEIQRETSGELLTKHLTSSLDLGGEAIRECLKSIGAGCGDVDYLCCATTTGFLSPGLSAWMCRHLNLEDKCARLDIVGMGCNAGLNALNATTNWALANPGKLAIMLCSEICSASYVFDGTMQTAVVNSLFGDGAAAVAITTVPASPPHLGPRLLKYSSLICTEAIEEMRFQWDSSQNRNSFYLSPTIPYIIGANIERAVSNLLEGTGVRLSTIKHWIIHSGGKKVIDAIKVNLGLTHHDLRHTMSILREYGNVSSASFLFSYQRLLAENSALEGDYTVMVTMGPGCTIESALLRF